MSKGQSRESGGTHSVKNGIATWNETTAVICFSSVSPDFRCLAHSFTLYMLLLSSSSSSPHRSSSSLTSLFYSETLGALDRRSTLTMERAGFHGYHHHKLPRLNPSSSSSSSQGMNHSQGVSTDRPPMINGHKNTTANAGGGSSEQDPTDQCTVREQDRYMPIANVIRIMRRILPGHAKISDDAKETIQECVSEFIGFVTGEANDRCQQEQRKTITAEDVLFAMSKLGFDSYVDPLSLFLHRYRELEFGSDVRGVPSGQTLIAKRGADNGGGYDYGTGGFVAHPMYNSGGGYYGPPPMPPPPPPGFDSSYGPRNNG